MFTEIAFTSTPVTGIKYTQISQRFVQSKVKSGVAIITGDSIVDAAQKVVKAVGK